MVDGATSNLKRVDSKLLLLPSLSLSFPAVLIYGLVASFISSPDSQSRSSIQFDLNLQKKMKFLYKSSPRFEPSNLPLPRSKTKNWRLRPLGHRWPTSTFILILDLVCYFLLTKITSGATHSLLHRLHRDCYETVNRDWKLKQEVFRINLLRMELERGRAARLWLRNQRKRDGENIWSIAICLIYMCLFVKNEKAY